MSISERIKKLRKSLGMSQQDFGDKIGVGTSHVSQWERDLSLPSGKALIGMAKLGVNINWLLTGAGEMLLENNSGFSVKGEFSEEQLQQLEKLIDGKIDERLKSLMKWKKSGG